MGAAIISRHIEQIGPYRAVVTVKAIRRMSLRISDNGELLVSVPAATAVDYKTFVIKNAGWIEAAMEKIRQRRNRLPEATPELLKAFYDSVPAVVEKWQREMHLRASEFKVKMMKSRWGSCNHVTRAITLNFRLALYPKECLDYVVIHELAHLVHPNHSPRFWELVEQYCPDWKRIRRSLR